MTESDWQNMMLLLLCWLAYFTLHSTLASLWVKNRLAALRPGLMPAYRMAFNVLAVLLLLPILWLMYRAPGPTLWRWDGAAAWLANGLALAALLGFLHTLKFYDMREFIGLRQWQRHTRRVEDLEHFHLSPFHHFVRHPWYLFGLVLIWTRDMNLAFFASSVMMTLYFIIGSHLEERKLLVYHGEVYRRYMARVPGLLPLPWKSLSAAEAAELVGKSAANPPTV